jgi:serine/threonine protein kinase
MYMKGRVIGHGSFSRCFSFRCPCTGDTVAVKAMAKAACKTTASFQQLQREISIHASLGHAHVRTLLRA